MSADVELPALAPPTLPVRTERLVLRLVRAEDRAAIGAYCVREDVTRYLPFGPLDEEGLTGRMERMTSGTAPSRSGDHLTLAVEHDGVVVGDLMLRLGAAHGPSDPPSIAELGWVFSPDVAGRGFATEAAGALIDLAFGHYPLHRLVAQLDPRNTASARLCSRLGMTAEAHTREDYPDRDGGWSDTAVYGLLRREWEAARA